MGQRGGQKPNQTSTPTTPATPDHLQGVWRRAVQLLAAALTATNLSTYIQPLALLEITDEVASLGTFDPFVRDQVADRYSSQLTEVLSNVVGHPVRVELGVVAEAEFAAPTVTEPAPEPRQVTDSPKAPHGAEAVRALWYMASPWCQVAALPVQSGRNQWIASQGHTTLKATATELPHGHLGRRLLAHLSTCLVRSRHLHQVDTPAAPIQIATSVADLLRQLGVKSDTGGERGTRTGVLRQLELLLNTTWAITEGEQTVSFRLFEEGPRSARPERGQPIELTPTQEARNALAGRMVPVSRSAIVDLGRDSTAVDLYLWATWRNGTGRRGERHTIGPKGVSSQMGRRWQHTGAWMARIGTAVDRVRSVYGALSAVVAQARGHIHRALTLIITDPDIALRTTGASSEKSEDQLPPSRAAGKAHPSSRPSIGNPRAPPASA